jgi:hypothetical protein
MRRFLLLGLALVFAAGIISCQATRSQVNTDGKNAVECPLEKMGVVCKSDDDKPCPISQGKGPCNDCVQEAAKMRQHQDSCKGHDGKPNQDMMGMMKKQQEMMAQFEKMNQDAADCLVAKEYKKAIEILKAIEAKFQPHQLVSYNMACAYSLSGNVKSAVAELRKSIQLGWFDWKHMDTDTDLNNIRNDADYKKLRSSLEAIYPGLPADSGCGGCPTPCK